MGHAALPDAALELEVDVPSLAVAPLYAVAPGVRTPAGLAALSAREIPDVGLSEVRAEP